MKSRLLGILCICVIALVATSTNANGPLASGLLNTVFILSCAVLGVVLLREAHLTQTLIVRQRGNRRYDMPAEFPLEDSQGVIVIQDRRRLPDRRKAKYDLDDLKTKHTKMASN